MRRPTPRKSRTVDYLLIGAGPGVLQLAFCLQLAGRDYLVLERESSVGGFFHNFPRHRQLISVNKLHVGSTDPEVRLRFDWHSFLGGSDTDLFSRISEEYFPKAGDYIRYLEQFVARHALKIRYDTPIARIKRESARFHVASARGEEFVAKRVVVGTGVGPFLPSIPGIELTESYATVSIDPRAFTGQRVLIIGKGNSSFETANNLTGTAALIHLVSPTPLKFAWDTHFVGHLRAVNNDFLDTYQLKLQNAILDANVKSVARRSDNRFVVSLRYSHAQGECEDIVYDRVISCTGFRFDHSIFDASCQPALTIDDRFPAQTSAWESTNVKHLFFAGTVTQANDFKRGSSGFVHGFRYNSRTLHRICEHRYHGMPLRHTEVHRKPAILAAAVIARLSRSSALWQQFGFLADAIEMGIGEEPCRYYEELPLEFIKESSVAGREYYVITLEFGHVEGNRFAVTRHPDPALAYKSSFLHPVVRRLVAREFVEEVHLLENLFGDWSDPEVHVNPLTEFFKSTQAPSRVSTASSPNWLGRPLCDPSLSERNSPLSAAKAKVGPHPPVAAHQIRPAPRLGR